MDILVTSASGANGNGYGAILRFGPEGEFTGPFSSDPTFPGPARPRIPREDYRIRAGLLVRSVLAAGDAA
jgi:hypothetical protein